MQHYFPPHCIHSKFCKVGHSNLNWCTVEIGKLLLSNFSHQLETWGPTDKHRYTHQYAIKPTAIEVLVLLTVCIVNSRTLQDNHNPWCSLEWLNMPHCMYPSNIWFIFLWHCRTHPPCWLRTWVGAANTSSLTNPLTHYPISAVYVCFRIHARHAGFVREVPRTRKGTSIFQISLTN